MKKEDIAGKKITALGQGTWNMGDDPNKREEEIRSLRFGVDNGLELIDTAEMYGNGRSESLVGEAIKGIREKVLLVSKVLPSHASSSGTISACEQSLRRLQVDCLDLYLLHWSGNFPLYETIEAFEKLKSQGKIAEWGVSNLDIDEMQEIRAMKIGAQCATDQVLYNLTRRGIEYDLLPWCQDNNIPIMGYSPIEQNKLLTHKIILQLAENHGATPSQIALAWILQKNGVIPIPKSSSYKHVEENIGCFNIKLSKSDNELLDQTFPPPKRKAYLEMI